MDQERTGVKKHLWLAIVITAALIIIPTISYARLGMPLSDSLVFYSPTSCPTGGCAAGQRINFKTTYDVNPLFVGSNVQVCLYTPTDGESGAGTAPWIDPVSFSFVLNGEITNQTYIAGEATVNLCTAALPNPSYTFTGGAYATLPTTPPAAQDRLSFALRINRSSDIDGLVVVKILEVDASGASWSLTGQPDLIVNVTPAALTAYAANDPVTCGANAPCYVNSGDDLPTGLGTGLKDAIDAQTTPATINIIANYSIKSNTVLLNQAHTIQGSNTAALTYTGTTCSQPMLQVTSGASIRHLFIADGSCSSASRDLITVNSPSLVTIENNTLTYGNNAISINDSSGDTLIRYNQIQGNAGYAILRSAGTSVGVVKAVANNLYGNRTGAQAECNNKGLVDHNFWGAGISTSTAVSRCTVTEGKHLGAAILHNLAVPGVDAGLVNVASAKNSAFNDKIAFQHSTSESDFGLYVVNHGYGNSENVPFYGQGTGMLISCSNFWDVFLEDGTTLPNTLNLYYKYDLNTACTVTIESSSYCGQVSNPEKYPLYWYDPLGNATNGWNTTGQYPDGPGGGGATGQLTTCLTASKEIEVSIDYYGRPNFINDLHFLPMTVGLPTGIDLVSFTATPAVGQVLIQWITSSEVNISGYYIVRSEQPDGVYSRTSGFVPAKGNGDIGGIYSYTDTDLVYGRTYYYKLEVIGSNNQTIIFYGPISAITGTATPTVTATRTITMTPTITPTRTITLTPTITATGTVTRTKTITKTYTPYYSSTPFKSRTPTRFVSATSKPSTTPTTTRTGTMTVLTGSRTATSLTATTPAPTPTPFIFTPGPDEGYPVDYTMTPYATPDEGGYPNPSGDLTATIDNSGYPVFETAQTSSTPASAETPSSAQATPTPTTARVTSPRSPLFWVLLFSGGLIVLGAACVFGFLLYKRRIR
jgi:hypothetical protein